MKKKYPLAKELKDVPEMSLGQLRFMKLIINSATVAIILWCVLFYMVIIGKPEWLLPHLTKLLTLLFLSIPLVFFSFQHLFMELRDGIYSIESLERWDWIIKKWIHAFLRNIFFMAVFGVFIYAVLGFVKEDWLASALTIIDNLVGIPFNTLGCPELWGVSSALYYGFLGVLIVVDFLLLWSAIVPFAQFGAWGDLMVIDQKLLSPALYGTLAKWFGASFFMAVLLSVGGAISKIGQSITTVFGIESWPMELDLLTETIKVLIDILPVDLSSWVFLLQLPILLTIARLFYSRILYLRLFLGCIWSHNATYLGMGVLVIPIFFWEWTQNLPLGNFFQAYILIAQIWYALCYLMYSLPILPRMFEHHRQLIDIVRQSYLKF